MARVRTFSPSTQHVTVHPTEVDCEYAVVDHGQHRLLHLATFGSDDREVKRKASQQLQLDVDRARMLIGIIADAFPELRSGGG